MQLAHIHVGNAMRLGDLRAMHGSDARRTGCEAVHLAREGVRMVARAVERGRGRRGEGGPPYFSSALRNRKVVAKAKSGDTPHHLNVHVPVASFT